MPLHLLPKKSWNVYNADNVERVRRDEAAARAAEEAKEERMQEADAARRLAVLRGEEPPPLPEEEEKPLDPAAGPLVVRGSGRDGFAGERRKRKRAGEDDTDFGMRVARERAAQAAQPGRRRSDEAPLELAGLLDPAEQRELVKRPPGRDEVEAEKRRAAERLANPALKDALGISEDPWFLKPRRPGEVADAPGRDAWGNEDPGRKARDAVRLDKNDPLAMMKRGAAKVREVTKERKRELEERERELKMLRKEEKRKEKRRRSEGRAGAENDDLEAFSLDAPSGREDRAASERRHTSEFRHGHSGEGRHRHSSRSGSDRHRHRHRHGSREDRDRGRERETVRMR